MRENKGNNTTLIHGDALEELAKLEPGSVDCVCTDPPYGTTDAPWDTAPDWGRLFAELWRVLKPNGALLMFSQNPVAADIIVQQRHYFRYEWVWAKTQSCGFLNANRMPMRAHELVLVFYRALPTYNRVPIASQWKKPYSLKHSMTKTKIYGTIKLDKMSESKDGRRAPQDVIRCSFDAKRYHATQKPQELLRALLSQYCRPGDLVLDPFAGSGSTLVAARELGLRSIGFELTEHYYNLARERLAEQTPLVSQELIFH